MIESAHVPTFDGSYWIVQESGRPESATTFLNWTLLQDFLAKNQTKNLDVKEFNIGAALNKEFPNGNGSNV